MNLFFETHNKTFKAEWIKLKRTGTIWLCLGVALIIPLVAALVEYFINNNSAANNRSSWDLFIESSFGGFAGFFFPLFLVITILRLVYMEHKADTWKLLQTQPVSRVSLFLVKYEVGLIISLLSLFALLIFAMAGALFLQLGMPNSGYKTSGINWSMHLSAIFRLWIATWGLLAVQYFISLVLKSFAWPMTIGLVAIIAGASFGGFNILNWFPYAALSYTMSAYKGADTGNFLLPHEMLSILWAILFLLLGYQYFIKRDFARAFFRPVTTAVVSAAVLLAFFFLFWWINRPVVLDRYGKTVIAGTIEVDKPVDKIVIVSAPAFDTVMIAEVVDGKFHSTTDKQIAPGIYFAKAGATSFQFFFGPQDSLFLNISNLYGRADVKFGGTRLAENEFLKNNKVDFYFLSNYSYNYTPQQYAYEILKEWKGSKEKIEDYKTVGNIKPAPDFIAIQKKLLALQLLALINIEYPKTYAVYHPNEKLTYPPILNELNKQVDFSNDTLAGYPGYIKYITDYIGVKTSESHNRDSATFQFIMDSLPSERVKNEVFFALVNEKLDYVRDSTRRFQMLASVLPMIRNTHYRQLLVSRAEKLNGLMKGRKAPEFTADALTGKQLSLSNFANRYVVIDVWATWCVPCKKEEPFFDEMANRYTSPGIAFVSLSVDEDRMAWQREAPSKSKRVVQLWAQHGGKAFSEAYAVNSIPRFMLIDPKGKIVNAQLPPPSDPEFEAILEKEIHPSFRYDF